MQKFKEITQNFPKKLPGLPEKLTRNLPKKLTRFNLSGLRKKGVRNPSQNIVAKGVISDENDNKQQSVVPLDDKTLPSCCCCSGACSTGPCSCF